jgi:hypothetical protein
MGLCGEHIQESYTVFLNRFLTYKIALPPQTKPRMGGPQTPAAKSLYWSIFKKIRHLGFGVFIVFWSMSITVHCTVKQTFLHTHSLCVLM